MAEKQAAAQPATDLTEQQPVNQSAGYAQQIWPKPRWEEPDGVYNLGACVLNILWYVAGKGRFAARLET